MHSPPVRTKPSWQPTVRGSARRGQLESNRGEDERDGLAQRWETGLQTALPLAGRSVAGAVTARAQGVSVETNGEVSVVFREEEKKRRRRRTRNTATNPSESASSDLTALEVAGSDAVASVNVGDGTLEEVLSLASLRLTLRLLRSGKLSTLDAGSGLGALLEGGLVRVESGGGGAAGERVG
jgi:hypothetical protein